MRPVQVTGPVCELGEGPVWWPDDSGLRWVDIMAGDVLHLDPGGHVHRTSVGAPIGARHPVDGGRSIAATGRRPTLLDQQGHPIARWAPVSTDPAVRLNDAAVDPHGRLWCGTTGRPGRAALYLVDPVRPVRVLSGLTISNGLGWTPDLTHALHVDTPANRVDVYRYDRDGLLSGRRTFATLTEPDGLCVDEDGGVWVARWGHGVVQRFTPGGTVDVTVEVPTRHVTACTLGGPDLRTLFITTARRGPDLADGAGAVYAVQVAVRGIRSRTVRHPDGRSPPGASDIAYDS